MVAIGQIEDMNGSPELERRTVIAISDARASQIPKAA